MVDLSQLLSNAAETKADFNFGKLNDAYWAGLEQAYKQRTRDAFQDPSLYDASGNLDPGKAFQQALKVGGIPAAEPAAKLSDAAVLQQFYGNAAGLNRDLYGGGRGASVVSPPSVNRSASEAVQPDLTQGRSTTASPDDSSRGPLTPPPASAPPPGGHSVTSYVLASGIPNDQGVAVSASIARQLGVNPNDPIDTNDPRIRNTLVPAIQQMKRMGIGQTYGPGEATPAPQVIPPINPQVAQAAPQPPQAAPQPAQPQQTPLQPTPVQTVPIQPTAPVMASDAGDQTLGGIISPRLLQLGGGTSAGALDYLRRQLRSGLPPGPIADDVKNQIAKIQERLGAAEQKASETRATARATSDVKEQDEYIAEGKQAQNRLFALNALVNVASNDKNAGFGFGADTELKVKKALQRIGFDFGDLSGTELVQKMNSVLAGEMAKSVTNRPTQFEFKTFIANNPGLLTTREGTVRLGSIYQQMAQRDIDLGKAARKQDNWDNWGSVVERYDATHPIIDPVLKKPIYTQSIVAPGPEGGVKPAATITAQGTQKFASPSDVRAAVSSGKLKKGDTFLDTNGTPRLVP